MAKPDRIYRYFSLNQNGRKSVEEAILNQKLYYQDPRKLNDPYECLPNWDFGQNPKERKEYLEALLRKRGMSKLRAKKQALWGIRGSAEDFRKILEVSNQKMLERIAICCFSERWDSLLMWAHYANSYSGVCLEFDTVDRTEEFVAFPIDYRSSRPRIDFVNREGESFIRRLILTKNPDWSYEREWRTFKYEHPAGLYPFPAEQLKGVLFGPMTSEADVEMVTELAVRSNLSLSVRRLSLSQDQFRLE